MRKLKYVQDRNVPDYKFKKRCKECYCVTVSNKPLMNGDPCEPCVMLFFPIGSVWFRNYTVTQTTGAKTMISRSEVNFSRLPTYLHTCKPTVSVVIPYESYIYMGGL